MSASRRRKKSDRKRGKPDPDPIDELPELEPVEAPVEPTTAGPDTPQGRGSEDAELDELPELEAVDEGDLDTLETLDPLEDDEDESPVTASHAATDEDGFDQRIDLTVPSMTKSEVPAAVDGPLRRTVSAARRELRFQRVLVHFGGDAIVGSAVKKLITEVLKPAKPLKVVVRRGFGDEIVLEGSLPTVDLEVKDNADALEINVDAAGCDPDDLAFAMRPDLAQLRPAARGKRVAFTFSAGVEPDDDAVAAIREELADAARVEVSGRVLFDKDLEARVRITPDSGSDRRVSISPDDDVTVTCAALQLVLPRAVPELGGAAITIDFEGAAPRDAELAMVLDLLAAAAPSRIALARGDAEPDVLWPRLLRTAVRDDQGAIRVDVGDRGPDAVRAAFVREAAGLAEVVSDKRVTVDWPAGFGIDDETEQACIEAALGALGPKSVSCTWNGQDREPYLPVPITFRIDAGDLRVIHVDTDAGKPVDLVRAIDRRVGPVAQELRGKPVRIEITGSGAVSRTMVRTLRGIAADGGATRVELDDHGTVDVLLPALLTISTDAERTVSIAADASGRDAAQVQTALQRELDAAELPEQAAVVVEPSSIGDDVVAAVVARGAARVSLGDASGSATVQVHPTLFAPAARDENALSIAATPDGEEPVLLAQLDRELGPLLDAEGSLAETDVTVVWPGAGDRQAEPIARTLEAVLARGPRKLLFDDGGARPEQLFPEVVPDYLTVLGRKDDATPPMLMLGIDAGEGDEHRSRVMEKLAAMADDADGKRVLLVLRDLDQDVRIEDGDALIAAVREVIDPKAVATLVFRGRDPHRRNYFEVVHSTIDGLTAGAKIADPRPKKASPSA